jgi:hypothetical protein
MKVIFEKINSSFPKMKSYLDNHLRVVHMSRLWEKTCSSWAPFFSNSGHSRPKFDQPRMKAIWEKWNYGFKNIK